MNEKVMLNDIADDLLIVNKHTIDTLFSLENCADCIALYIFYYKTAKWQKTNVIKANNMYVKKSLKWGIDKINKTKKTLKEHGLIKIVQRRENGKVIGWYIEVSYLVSQQKIDNIKVKVESTIPESNNTQKQQYPEATSGNEDTNALKEYIKCLENKIETLKDNNKKDYINISNQSYQSYYKYSIEFIKKQIWYDSFTNRDKSIIDGLIGIMYDTLNSSKDYFRVNSDNVPADVVRSRLLELNRDHLEYVATCIGNNETEVKNMNNYMLTALYNSPVTINSYYDMKANHDLAEQRYRFED